MFSYLQFHTQSLDISQEQLEALRLNVAKASPLAAALETCLGLVDAETLPAVVMQIKTVVKTGVGRDGKLFKHSVLCIWSGSVQRFATRLLNRRALCCGLISGLPTLNAAAKAVIQLCSSDLALSLKEHSSELLRTFQVPLPSSPPYRSVDGVSEV